MTWICRSRSTSAKVSAASITSHPARRRPHPDCLRSSQVPTAMSRSTRRSSCPFEGSNATFGSSKTVLFQGVYLPVESHGDLRKISHEHDTLHFKSTAYKWAGLRAPGDDE